MLGPGENERGQRLGRAILGLVTYRPQDRGGELTGIVRLSPGFDRERQPARSQDLPGVAHVRNVTTMAPLRFDRARIQAIVQLVGERLEGEWLLIGGGAAAAWFAPSRTTEDLDLVGLAGTQAERFALMELAADAGIPIEAVNSAADYFVRRITGWRDELVVLARGSRGVIYRPSATLFLLLKLRRLTAVDLADCLALIEHCKQSKEPIERERVRTAIEALPASADQALTERRLQLREALGDPE